MSLFTAPPDMEVVRGILLDLSRVCTNDDDDDGDDDDDDDDGIERAPAQQQQQQQQQQLLQTLEASEKVNPQFVMTLCTLITPNLFLGPCESLNLTHQESIAVLMVLATKTKRPETYLKAASRAIKTFIQTTTYSETGTQVQFQVSNHLLQLMIAQLSGNDVEVSTNATEAVVACCRRLPHLSDNALVALENAWKTTWEHKDVDKQNATTLCVRCANAIVELWCLPGNHNRTSTSSSLNPLLVMMTDSSDPLLQMSTLDLMEKLATVKPIHTARAQWLYSPSVIQPLLSMAGASGTPDPFMSGPALRLLSSLAKLCHYLQDVNHDDYDAATAAVATATAGPDLLLTSFHQLLQTFDLSGGEIDRLAFVDAVSSLASASSKALELVLGDPILLERWLSLAVAQPKLKAVVLLSLARVIYPPIGQQKQQQDGDASIRTVPNSALAIQLYLALGRMNGNRNVTDLLLHLARSPVIESRLGAYAVFEAVAKHGAVGSQVLLSQADFYDMLVSRQYETTMEGREAKYAIVVAVVTSDVRALLADNIVKTLDTYVSQGPHYVPTQRWDVMTGE